MSVWKENSLEGTYHNYELRRLKEVCSQILYNSRIKVDWVRSGWAISMIIEGMSISVQVRKLYSN